MTAQPTRKAKAGTVKARYCWAYATEDCEILSDCPPAKDDRFGKVVNTPVFILPADEASVERMIAQATVALEQADSCDHREDACIVLRSLGLTLPTPSRLRAKPQGEK